MRAIAARCRLGAAMLDAGDASGARRELGLAADSCDADLPEGHPLLPLVLGNLAKVLVAEGEFVAAEGLYRTATDVPTSATSAPCVLPSLSAFADLLDRLETNGKPRQAEASLVRKRAAQLHEDYPEVLGAGRSWLGLEPWYVATYDVDYLTACSTPE
jgi:hypothetical protein